MAVRTRRIAGGDGLQAGTTHDLYTVPAGRTAILKDVVLQNLTGSDLVAAYGVRRGTQLLPCRRVTLSPSEVFVDQERYVVLEPGDGFYAFSAASSGTFRVLAFGVLLDGAPA